MSQENAVQNAGGAGFMRRLCNGWFHVPPQETHRSGEIYRKILILGLPILMENLVVQLASLFKKLILGQLHSMEILSAFITANTGMQWPMTVVLTIAMSMMILAARANGEQNDAQVNRILHQGMKLMGISALILAVNRFFIIPEVLVKELVYVDGAMRSMVLDYYRTAVWGVIPMALTIAISAVLYGIGKPVFALCYRVVGVLAELLLFFGFAAGGFHFGGSDIQCLALVSVIGSGVIFAAALALLLLCRKNLKLDFKGFLRIHFDSIKRILLISIPVLLLLSSISARTLVYREIIPVEMAQSFMQPV